MEETQKLTQKEINTYISLTEELNTYVQKFLKKETQITLAVFIAFISPFIIRMFISDKLDGIFFNLVPIILVAIAIFTPLSTIISNSIVSKLKIIKTIEKIMGQTFNNTELIFILSKLSNHYQTERHSNEYRIKLYEFFENIKNKQISTKDIELFRKINLEIQYIQSQYAENKKIEFIKNINKNDKDKEIQSSFNFLK